MFNLLKTAFSYERNSGRIKTYNLVQSVYLLGLLLMTGIVSVCLSDDRFLYLTIILIFLLIITLIDVNYTGRMKHCIIIVSLFTNLFYLPLCFYGFGKFICCVPLYFILGILYTVLMVQGKLGAIIAIIETLFYCFVIMHLGNRMPGLSETSLTLLDVIAICIAIIVVGVLSIAAVTTRNRLYYEEYNNVQDTHLNVIDAYNSKDIFFANTSHEIRTPLNAIVGTVNLLLDEELDSGVRENVYSILSSCNALLSITDELIELSNTESTNVKLSAVKYNLSELLSDIINMMSVRLMEGSVVLYADVDKNLPKYLYGDGGKVRQVFINILNNAVKYTKEGKILLKVYGDRREDGVLDLKVEVSDTGMGIKEEALPNIFMDYRRDDDSEKRNIEGTGLGLSFCKYIIELMGGSISVASEYHVGSTFSFNIPQQIEYKESIAEISDSYKYSSIIFEKNKELARGLEDVLKKLNVPAIVVNDRMEFETSVLSGKYENIFIAIERFTENKRFIERKILDKRLIIITDISQSVQVSRSAYILSRPMHTINVAMAFNNENNRFAREIIQKGGFTCPNSTILVVDDNLTNLEVASGLLKRYESNIITAVSGAECLSIMENTHVDIVFLDYMMPEMNGIDTFYNIRSMELENAKTVPVVALTANVVSGAREMFMEAGFSAYISKPIDVSKLEKTLRTLLPREQLRIKI